MKYRSIITISFLLIIASSRGLSQFYFSPSPVLTVNQVPDTMTYDSIAIHNQTAAKLHLAWERITYDTLNGSYFDFCASGNCYLHIPLTGNFPYIDPGQFGYAGAHFWTGSTATSCTTRIRIYDTNNPAFTDTLTFILNSIPNSINNYQDAGKDIVIGPNPSSGILNISKKTGDIEKIEVCNNEGKIVHSVTGSKTIDLSSFPNNTYHVLVISDTGISTKKIILLK